jgi:hypothetical protein
MHAHGSLLLGVHSDTSNLANLGEVEYVGNQVAVVQDWIKVKKVAEMQPFVMALTT